jgi:hypothetical protein
VLLIRLDNVAVRHDTPGTIEHGQGSGKVTAARLPDAPDKAEVSVQVTYVHNSDTGFHSQDSCYQHYGPHHLPGHGQAS